MTPEAAERQRVYQEGQRAFNSGASCPYIDWRAGTWSKGYQAASAYHDQLASAEEEARQVGYYSWGGYVDIRSRNEVVLDGTFTTDQLVSLVEHLKTWPEVAR